jgi:hypothetical protein
MPVDDLEKKIATLPADKPIVFVCGTGARSGESYYMVKDLRPELKEVYYLDGELTIHKDGTFALNGGFFFGPATIVWGPLLRYVDHVPSNLVAGRLPPYSRTCCMSTAAVQNRFRMNTRPL